MKTSVAKKGTPRYFTAKLGWKEQFDPKEIEMLSAGVVPMLIPPVAVQGRKNNVIDYDVTQYTTLEFYLTCILSREQFVELLLQFAELFRRMQAVYLNYKNLVLELDQIYIFLQDRSLHLIYLPLRDSKREASIPELLRKLAAKVNRGTYEQVTFLNEMTAFLDRPAPFALNEFEELLRRGEAPQPVVQPVAPAAAPAAAQAWYTPPVAAPAPVVQVNPEPAAPQQMGGDPNGTVILGAGGGTTILGEPAAPPMPRAYLTRTKTGEKVEVVGTVFRIGKEIGQVHYCIADNSAVSRSHAEILLEGQTYFLRDLGSTNKTYLDNCVIAPNDKQPLADGASVRLANETFTFTLEG